MDARSAAPLYPLPYINKPPPLGGERGNPSGLELTAYSFQLLGYSLIQPAFFASAMVFSGASLKNVRQPEQQT